MVTPRVGAVQRGVPVADGALAGGDQPADAAQQGGLAAAGLAEQDDDLPFAEGTGPVSGTETRTLFGQTMEYVAITAGFFALGAYTGRNLSSGWAVAAYIAAFACLIAMRFTVQRSAGASAVLLFVFGVLMGLAMSPTLVYYASVNPQALWQAGGATALFMAACGGIGFATRRDLSGLARALGGHRLRAADGRLDLPGRAERVPVLPATLLQGQQIRHAWPGRHQGRQRSVHRTAAVPRRRRAQPERPADRRELRRREAAAAYQLP